MKKWVSVVSLLLCGSVFTEPVAAAGLNEWTFEKDAAGLTLSQTLNSGAEGAVFASGGSGFLETDGAGSLLCTHAGGMNMWTDGAALKAGITNVSSGIRYLRCDLHYTLSDSGHTGGAVTGLGVADASGTNVADVVFLYDLQEPAVPAEGQLYPVATNLNDSGSISMIVRLDMDTRTMAVWYDLTGSNSFDENNPAADNVPVNLSSIDQLRFQTTGDFQPSGSTDYVAVDNIRTASSWPDITAPPAVELSLHPLFHDHMVLQRDMNVPVWGRATPGSEITIKLDGTVAGTATADGTGMWLAEIGSHVYDGGLEHVLLISVPGETDIQINDVVFGDVYIASGQSNMAQLMRTDGLIGFAEEQAAADACSLIRQITVSQAASTTSLESPQLQSGWTVCNSSSISNFSAVAYFFAKNIYVKTGVPVGVIFSAWGGQKIERFLSPSGTAFVPELSGFRQEQEEGREGVPLYDIYHAMIAPLIPCGIRGALWYQGEGNADDGDIYRQKMLALIRGWRQDWNRGDFPFYFVQLPNYTTTQDWPGLRATQLETLSETNTGMAVTIDVGDDDNVHPLNKIDTGYRLAQWALAKIFEQNISYSGPLYHSASIEGSQIRILFDYAANGLITGWKDCTNPVVQTSGLLQNFEIAGTDRNFTNATAVIDQDSVIVSNPAVSSPAYVRYCYADVPPGTNKLYNADGLPASPFRTDRSYRLDVRSGGGTANNIEPGAQVVITANPPPSGQVFDRWIGAASEIDNLNSATATVIMPEHSLYLLATYRNISAPVYTNTVNGGSGSGTSKEGSILNIEAPSVSGKQFDHWSGDTQSVVNVQAATTTLRMPASNVTVTAVYRTVDSAGDGIPDSWRAFYFGGNGTTTNIASAAGADPDGDGMTNFQEYMAGTSPLDAGSVLRLSGRITGNSNSLDFRSVAGRYYRMETSASLTPAVWQPLFYNITGDGMPKHLAFSTGALSKGFYRLRLTAN